MHDDCFVSAKTDFSSALGKIEIMFKRDGKIDIVVPISHHSAVANSKPGESVVRTTRGELQIGSMEEKILEFGSGVKSNSVP